MKKTIPISVVIPFYNGGVHIRTTLSSIHKSSFKPKEIIIVNDGSDKKNSAILHNLRSKFKAQIIDIRENKGVAHARNMGLRKASTEYVLFLDQDCAIDRKALRVIQNVFDENESVGGIQMKLLDYKTRIVESQGHFLSIFGFPYELTDRIDKEFFIFGAKTAGFAVRNTVASAIKGFDEDYMIHSEDTDFCWRIWLAGYKIIYVHNAIGYHVKTASINHKKNSSIFYEGPKNGIATLIKNADISILIWILPLHILGWITISILKLVSKDLKSFISIYQGIIWDILHLSQILAKRKNIKRQIRISPKLLLGPYSISLLSKKGLHWLRSI